MCLYGVNEDRDPCTVKLWNPIMEPFLGGELGEEPLGGLSGGGSCELVGMGGTGFVMEKDRQAVQ